MYIKQISYPSLSLHHLQYNLRFFCNKQKKKFLKEQSKPLKFLGILAAAGASNLEAFYPQPYNNSESLPKTHTFPLPKRGAQKTEVTLSVAKYSESPIS